MFKTVAYSEREAAYREHKARETQRAIDTLRGKKQSPLIPWEQARDYSHKLNREA